MKNLLVLLFAFFTSNAFADDSVLNWKVIDDGGSGPYKAVACSEETLSDFVVYKPQQVQDAVKQEGALPLLVFANGGCNDTSLPHEKMLNDLASYGYIVVALGKMQERLDDRELKKSPNEDMIRAIDWFTAQNKDKKSPYYRCVDIDNIAMGGQSCGGAQVLSNCKDKRVTTCLMFNSGMGDMEMSGASKKSLGDLHSPILYILGGDDDVAYQNAIIDYDNVTDVPVAFANQLRVGHGGTFHETYGGTYSKMARYWMDWQLKGKNKYADVFLNNDLVGFPDWTMKAKNFPEVNEPFRIEEIHCMSRDGKDIWGMAYIPNTPEVKKPTVIMAHGFNGTYRETKPFAESLAMRGVASYIFDFCGGGNMSQSEGKTTEMTIFTEKENIEDIARTVMSWDFVDSSRMALLGCSQGGLVASITAAANPTLFKSLILVYPALSIPDTASRMLAQFDANNGEPMNVMSLMLGRVYYEKINGLDVAGTVGAYKGDVFMVYGDQDGIVTGGKLDKVQKVYQKCQVQVIPTGKHGFPDYLNHAQATEGIAEFVNRTLVQR